MAHLLEAAHLRKAYDRVTAVDDVSLHVSAGEVFGLLGPNGAGKTTTMSMIAGLLPPDAGTIHIDERELQPADHAPRRELGFVPQELAVYPDLTARENLVFFGRLYGLRGQPLTEAVERVLQQIGLTERAGDRVGTFSGGMKRRLNFGLALIHGPRVLILDEPTVGVDPQSRAHLLDAVRRLSDEGVAVLYASHYMEEVEAVCQRVGIMDHGKMLACDTLQRLLARVNTELTVQIAGATANLTDRLRDMADVQPADNEELILTLTEDATHGPALTNGRLEKLLNVVKSGGARIQSINTPEPNLEQLFLELTGHSLRD